MTTTSYMSTLRRASEDIKLRTHEFEPNLRNLGNFENNVSHYNCTFADIDAVYDGDYSFYIRPLNKSFPIVDRVIGDTMQKTGVDFEARQAVFDAIKQVKNLATDKHPIGFDYLEQVLEKSKRDVRGFTTTEQRLIFYNDPVPEIQALKNHDFPYDVFRFSDFVPRFMDEAERRDKAIENPTLTFDRHTGLISGELLFDTIQIKNASVNDEIGYGLRFDDAKFGGKMFSFDVGMRILACSNGLTTTKNLLALSFRHSSEGNYAKYFYDLFERTFGKRYRHNADLTDIEKGIIAWLASKGLMPKHSDPNIQQEYQDRFYDLLSKSVFDTILGHKEAQVEAIETAATDNIEDFTKTLQRVWNDFRLPKSEFDNAQYVFDNDDLINRNRPTRYDLSNILSRMANDPSFNDDKATKYQTAAYQILMAPIPA